MFGHFLDVLYRPTIDVSACACVCVFLTYGNITSNGKNGTERERERSIQDRVEESISIPHTREYFKLIKQSTCVRTGMLSQFTFEHNMLNVPFNEAFCYLLLLLHKCVWKCGTFHRCLLRTHGQYVCLTLVL